MVTTRLPASLEPSQVPINFHDGNTSPMIRLWVGNGVGAMERWGFCY